MLLPDGTNVNHELVKAGWCWWCRKYAPGDTELERLEAEARDAKKGLWADPAPIPPWEVRHPKPRRVPLVGENLMSEGMDNPATTPTQIIGNRNSHIYHRPDCPSYTSTKPKNRVIFGNAAETPHPQLLSLRSIQTQRSPSNLSREPSQTEPLMLTMPVLL